MEAQRQRIAAEQSRAFQATQHERDAQGALAAIQGMLARGDFAGALQLGTWAQGAFGDTPLADQFGGLLTLAGARQQEQIDQQADAAAWGRYQAERAARHERYLTFRRQGMDALAVNDVPTAEAAFRAALNEEDDPNVRALLDQISRRTRRPAIAVADFDVRGDVGLPRRYAGAMLADALWRQFSPDDPRFRPLSRDELLAELGRAGLTMDDLMRTPVQPRLRRIGVRSVIVGTVMSTTLVDLVEGQAISSADIAAANRYALPRAMNDLASMLLMSPGDRRAYLGNLAWSGWLARGDAAAATGRWEEALAAYRNAANIRSTQDLTEKINAATRNLQTTGAVRRNYEAAMAAGAAAARAGEWGRAADAYQNALSFLNTPEARAAFENARGHLLQDIQQRHRLYQQAMSAGDAAAKAGDWARALAAYQQAMELEDTPAARNAVATAKQKIVDGQQARRRDYLAAMAAARAAIQAGNWGKALEAFTLAGGIENTHEAMTGMATARAKLAEQQSNRRRYEAAMSQGAAAAQAGDWAKALDAYTRAWQVENTREAGAGVATAKAKLAEAQDRKLYDAAMGEAEKAAHAGRWADALQAYQKAYGFVKTREASAGIAAAKKALSEARNAQVLYDRAMAAGAAAARAGEWGRALAAYQNAAALNNTPEAQAGIVNAKKHMVEATAGAEKKHEYDRLMQAGDAAGAAGKWQEALVAYQQAAAIDNNRLVQGKIAAAKKHLLEASAEEKTKAEYNRLMQAGDAAGAANKWQEA
ncbi:MAG: hypothetical protein NTV86_23680, partial [Planctomycetota bacterium]|nr:hypothetical protein [Planctomycetota bacterium]